MKKTHFLLGMLVAIAASYNAGAQTIPDGKRFTRNEQYEDAESVYNAIIAKKPKSGDAYYFAGFNFLQRGDTVSAADIFEKGLLNSPKYTLNYVGKAILQLRLGKNAEAESLFALAEKTKKKSLPLIYKEIGRAYLLAGADLSKTKQVEFATKSLEALNKSVMEDNEIQLLKGEAYYMLDPNNLGKAVELFIEAGYADPKDPMPLLKEALVYMKATNYETSMSKINDALALDNDFAPAYRLKAEVFSQLGQTTRKKEYRDSAVDFYKEYLRRNNNLSARKMFAQSLFLNGEYDECIKECESLLKLKEYPNLYGVIAYAIVQKNDTSLALNQKGLSNFELYEQKHVAKQNRGLATQEKYFKAQLLWRTRNVTAAQALYKEALSDTATALKGWYDNVFDLYYKSQDYGNALNTLKMKQAKVKILNSREMYYMAQCYNQIGNYEEAISTFHEIMKIDTSYNRGYWYIALNTAKIDPTDSTGRLSAAYLDYLAHLSADEKAKPNTKKEMSVAYGALGYLNYVKAFKMYSDPMDKAMGWPKTKEYYRVSIDNYKKYLELYPDKEDIIAQVKDEESFLAKIIKKTGGK